MELNFTVTNQKIKYVSNLYIVEKSRNYLTAKFSFSGSAWKNVVKTAIFKKGDKTYNVVLDANGKCNVPADVITKGILEVSVFGGDLITVDSASVKILKSGYEDGEAPTDPPPDVYAQILSELQDIRTSFITEDQLGQAVEDWLAVHVVEALSPEDVQNIVYAYMDEHKEEIKGEIGDTGATFTPAISEDAVLSWTNDKGKENPEDFDFKTVIPSKTSELENDSDFTTNEIVVAEFAKVGYSLSLSVDENFILTLKLLNSKGTTLSEKSIDLPIESMVMSASYENGILTLTLQNGQTLPVDISSIVRGLVNDSRTIAGIDLKDDITSEELISALGIDNKVDKVAGKGLSTNDYDNTEKATVSQNKADIAVLKSDIEVLQGNVIYKFGVENGIPYIEEL